MLEQFQDSMQNKFTDKSGKYLCVNLIVFKKYLTKKILFK